MQESILRRKHNSGTADNFNPATIAYNKAAPSHRATEHGMGNEALANCCCIAVLNSTAMVWTDEGCCCPIRDSYLLLGLEDGRILFMDPVVKSHKYLEFKTGKDPVLDMVHDVVHNCLITLYKLPDMMQFQIWSLPDLELMHEIYCAPDLRDYARVGYTLVTGHESGCVVFHALELATDPGLHKARMIPPYAEVIDVNHKPAHLAPVITIDVCVSLKIFCSCSNDGAIKIWNDGNMLMTEIMLDSSLSSACFLSNQGDLLVGFQKHIFIIDHSKVCAPLTVPETDIESFDKESFICEDPAVLYEGVTPNPDPVTLERYLVPFDIEFSKDFLEGRVKLEPEVVKQDESDGDSEVSMAPTEIYMSPDSTPRRRLSLVDLTLNSEASKFDLLKHMKKTLDHLAEKERKRAAELAKLQQEQEMMKKSSAARRRRERRQQRLQGLDEADGKSSLVKLGRETYLEDPKEPEEDGEPFSFPTFGVSPGSTPRSTPPFSPEALSDQAESESEEINEEIQVKIEVRPKHDDEISKFLEKEKEKLQSAAEKKNTSPVAQVKRNKFGFSDITVDAQDLMKETKKVTTTGVRRNLTAPLSYGQRAAESDSDAGEKKSSRKEKPVKKKLMGTFQRKPPSKPKKSDSSQAEAEPPTLMQALELKEQELAIPCQDRQEKMGQHQREGSDSSGQVTSDKMEKDEEGFQNLVDESSREHSRPHSSSYSVPELPTDPSLPSLPQSNDAAAETQPSISSAAASKAALIKKLGPKSAIDFHSLSKPQTGSDKDPSMDRQVSGGFESGISNIQGESPASAGSEESRAAFRIGLLSKGSTEHDDVILAPQNAQKNKSPTQSQNSEPNVRECHKDSTTTCYEAQKGKQLKKNSFSKSESTKSGGKHSDKESRSSRKLRTKTSTLAPVQENSTVQTPDLLDAYLERQKAKLVGSESPPMVVVITPIQTDGMLESASSGLKLEQPLQSPTKEEKKEKDTKIVSPSSYIKTEVNKNCMPSVSQDSSSVSPVTSNLQSTTPSLSTVQSEHLLTRSSTPISQSPKFEIQQPGNISMTKSHLLSVVEEPIGQDGPVPTPNPMAQKEKVDLRTSSPTLRNMQKSSDKHIAINSQKEDKTTTDIGEPSQVVPHDLQNELHSVSTAQLHSFNNKKSEVTTEPTSFIESSGPARSADAQTKHLCPILEECSQQEDHSVNKEIMHNGDIVNEAIESIKSSELLLVDEDIAFVHVDDDITAVNIQSSSPNALRPDSVESKISSDKVAPSPVDYISIVSRQSAASEHKESLPENEGGLEIHNKLTESPKESEEGSWDSDFSAYLSGESFDFPSSISVSENNDSADDRKGGTASSSSNAEPILQVKIRRKPWSHYRNRKGADIRQDSNQKASLELRRKFSQNDALTVQRNAILKNTRIYRKRAQSAVETSSFSRNRLIAGSPQSRISVDQCVLCAAEGVQNHTRHAEHHSQTPRSVDSDRGRNTTLIKEEGGGPDAVEAAMEDAQTPEGAPSFNIQTPTDEDASRRDLMDSPTMTDSWATPRAKSPKSPTPVDTPDPYYDRPPSQVFSDISLQQQAQLSTDLPSEQGDTPAAVGSEASQSLVARSTLGADTPDSGVVDSDLISVSRQGLRSAGPGAMEEPMGADDAQQTDLLTQSEMMRAKARPMTSIDDQEMMDKPGLQNVLRCFRQRPYTAQMRFQTEDLQTAFDTSLVKYQRSARSVLTGDQLYKNDDMVFSENWHERQIQRHMLIRMQKELRAQNAQKRRQAMHFHKQDRLKQNLTPEEGFLTRECMPTPRQQPVHSTDNTMMGRANTVHGTRPVISIPAPTPESTRPHTAMGVFRHQPRPPSGIQQQLQNGHAFKANQHNVEATLREKAQLGNEMAFRFRMRPQLEPDTTELAPVEATPGIEAWMIDPRNPHAIRPRSSKSIPSKCHRYMLVTKPKAKLHFPLPSPLEEQLLATRFPDQGEKVFRKFEGLLYRPPRRPVYGIEYSPYLHQLYG